MKLFLITIVALTSINAFALQHQIVCETDFENGRSEFNGVTIELTLSEELQLITEEPAMMGTTGKDQDDLYYLSLILEGETYLVGSLKLNVVENGGSDKLPNKYDQFIYRNVKIEVNAEKSSGQSEASFKFTKQNGKVILKSGSCNVVSTGEPVVD